MIKNFTITLYALAIGFTNMTQAGTIMEQQKEEKKKLKIERKIEKRKKADAAFAEIHTIYPAGYLLDPENIGYEAPTSQAKGDERTSVFKKPTFDGNDIEIFNLVVQKAVKYPDLAVANKISGAVIIKFTICTDGVIRHFVMQSPAHKILADEVYHAIKRASLKMEPATKNGAPIAILSTIRVIFKQ